MTPEQFCYWLQGYLAGTVKLDGVVATQLAKVFEQKKSVLGPAVAQPAYNPMDAYREGQDWVREQNQKINPCPWPNPATSKL